jgi:phosphoglycolate phosphatase
MPFPVVAFDLDGTLVDTAPDLAAALNHALAELGRPAVDPASVRHLVGHGARRLLERALGDEGAHLVEPGVAHFLTHYRAHIARLSRPFADAEDTLDRLRDEGARLAVCTNKSVALAEALIAELGWSDRFAAVLGADSRPWKKPDPRHLLDTIDAAGGGRAAFVGDSDTDSKTAAAAGIPFVFMRFGYSGEEPVAADVRLDRFADLPAALRHLAAVQDRFSGGEAASAR